MGKIQNTELAAVLGSGSNRGRSEALSAHRAAWIWRLLRASIVLTGLLGLTGTGTAHAKWEWVFEPMRFERSFHSPDFCRTGVPVNIDMSALQLWKVNVDTGQVWLVFESKQAFTNILNGTKATFSFANRLTSEATRNADGTFSGEDTLQGLTGKLRTTDGGVATVNAGNLTIRWHFTSNWKPISLEVTAHGPHPDGLGPLPLWIPRPTCSDLIPALGL